MGRTRSSRPGTTSNFHGHYGEFFPGIPGAIIAVLALVALFSARWVKWPGVFAVAAVVAVGESAAALLLAQGFNNEPIKYDTVMEALAVLAVRLWRRRPRSDGRVGRTGDLR